MRLVSSITHCFVFIVILGATATAQNSENRSRRDLVNVGATGQPNGSIAQVAYQEPSNAEMPAGTLGPDDIAVELEKIEASELDPELKADCIERLQQAKEWIDSRQEWTAQRESAEQEIESMPTRLRSVRARLSKPVELVEPSVFDDVTVAQLETRLSEMRHQLEAADSKAKEKQAEAESLGQRVADLSKELLEVEKKIEEAAQLLTGLTGTDILTGIRRLEQQARRSALDEQLASLKTKRRLLDASTELLPMERDLAVRTATANKKQLQRWQDAVSEWRKQESHRQAVQARRVAEQSHPALRSLAEGNAIIAEQRIDTANGIERTKQMIADIRESSGQLTEQFEELRGKIQHAAETTSTGILLRKHRSELPDRAVFAARSSLVQEEMPEAHLRLMQLKQWRRELADPDEFAAELLASVESSLASYDPQQVARVVNQLATDRRDFLDKLIQDQNAYLQDLNELDLANQAFLTQVTEIRDFLDQRVLWMRSNEMFGGEDLKAASQGLASLLRPSRWFDVTGVAVGDLVRRPAIGVAVLALFTLVLVFRARMVTKQDELCCPAAEGQPASFLRFATALMITFVISIRWPLLFAAIGYRLTLASGSTDWTKAVGTACLTTVLFVWGVELLRDISRREGIGEKLFGWPASVTSSIRGVLDVSLLIGTPLFATLQIAHTVDTDQTDSLQRFLFITILLLCGLQIGWFARPRGRLMRSLLEHAPDAPVCRMRRPIWLLATAAPLGFAFMSFVGYHFSAYQLSGRLAESGAAIVVLIIGYSLALCWFDVKSHNLQLRETDGRNSSEDDGHSSVVSNVANRSVRVDSIGSNSIAEDMPSQREFKELLRYAAMITIACGGWFIWSDVTPALRVLDRVELWQNIESVAETVVGKDGSESIRVNEHTVPTTLTDLLIAGLVVVGTVVLGRKIPSLLELTVLKRLPIDDGGRHAVGILVRYAATVAGLLLACHIIRLSWSSVQWLAAAMTVGLGFGLQEIFANLVSGLIILFERPIRAGDLVTVGDVTGNVTRMHIRATTITDFDRRELIVPNKKFITDNVINWTLSDPISRVVLPVGVAYGTDVSEVQKILLDIARRSSIALSEPEPTALFKGFGDSTLDMELRVFIPKRDLYVELVNEINGAINEEFSKAKIEIAFPQQDLHIKSVEPVARIVPRRRAEPASDGEGRQAA